MHLEAGRRISGGEGVVELGEHAAREADDAHGAVLEPLAPHAAVRGHGDDGFRLVVEHEAQRVGVMDGDVENDAAAGVRLLDPPALQMRRQIDGVEHPREQRLADPPRFDRLAHRAMRRGVAEMMVGPHDDAALAAFGDHRARVLERQRQRLFAQDMLAGRRGGENLVAMQLIGRGDIDGVHVLRFDKLFQARRRMGDCVLFRVSGRALRVRAHDGDGFAAIGAEGADHVLCGDRACADQSPTKFRHQCSPLVGAGGPAGFAKRPRSSGREPLPARSRRWRDGASGAGRRASRDRED